MTARSFNSGSASSCRRSVSASRTSEDAEDAIWRRAAEAASLRRRYGESALERFAKETGQARSTVFRLAQVHVEFVEKSRRRDNLTFTHHVEALSAMQPEEALALAERERWSVRELREHVRVERLANGGEPEDEDREAVVYDVATEAPFKRGDKGTISLLINVFQLRKIAVGMQVTHVMLTAKAKKPDGPIVIQPIFKDADEVAVLVPAKPKKARAKRLPPGASAEEQADAMLAEDGHPEMNAKDLK